MATNRPRITTMTATQHARMTPFAHEWIEWALRTGECTPTERARVEDGMRRCYELAGLRWHGNVVWVRSPIMAALAAPIAGAFLQRRDTVRETVAATVRATVAATVGGTVRDTVRETVRDTVGETVRDTVGETVAATVHGTVRDTVRETVGDTVDDTVDATVDGRRPWSLDPSDVALVRSHGSAVFNGVYNYLSGSWSWWQARNAFCIRELGACPDMAERIDAWQDACSAGWWYPHTDFVIVSDRPLSISLERVGPDGWGSHRMHNTTGPAIEWSDGWAIWCWHGTVVPEWVVTAPTMELIAAEKNTEVRRCAIESFGWGRYLEALGVEPISVEDDPGNPGRRLRLYHPPREHQPYPDPVRLLVMDNASLDRDGSRRLYAETVPVTCATAVDAAAWQFDTDPELYRQMQRAT